MDCVFDDRSSMRECFQSPFLFSNTDRQDLLVVATGEGLCQRSLIARMLGWRGEIFQSRESRKQIEKNNAS